MSEEPSPPTSPVITVPVPQADRQLLALHALRQRQIRTSFLHGRRRTWRDRRRIWPAVVIALALVALIIAGTSVVAAFQRQQQVEAQRNDMASFGVAAEMPTPANRLVLDAPAEHGPMAAVDTLLAR